ncbi:ribosyldihydronicotinamide dehydrogenase [quinone] isoform X3 [Python bivittatus]|uniref:Ribosyldihydronicotinamide dehydrogenase [quinone] isoform X3 n=1 Tax=Python bivittatus TaxID=176946 RepID=A0A9F5IB05_PYTBI|nr:ribosyldihydronicotinamide dehydrogenase [quinone] isoform X3 [Python bivittatus]
MAGKKVLIVYAHQEPKSLNGSLKTMTVEELKKQGCTVTVSNLYEMQFEPRATRKDIVGDLHNPDHFNYGVEAWKAYENGCLSEDLIEEQRKVKEADLVIFQFPLYWFSMPAILKGWMDKVLVQGFAHDFPKCYDSGLLKHGILHFCGFSVLSPQICFGPEYVTEEKRRQMLTSWVKRLQTIWEEKPINCVPEWYFGNI